MTETTHRYTAELAQQIELAWQDRWEEAGTFRAPNPAGPWAQPDEIAARYPSGEKLLVLDMFPYPSGAGLHIGHPLGYIATDVFARYHRMLGKNVLHCLGYDAFGLPAEQYAVQTGQHPRKTTEDNILIMQRQLRRLGLGHDDRRAIRTIDPEYYRWTQWIFVQIFSSWYDENAVRPDGGTGRARPIAELVELFASGERATASGRAWGELSESERHSELDAHRLAYSAEAPVNWAPGLGSVVANEEVTNDGRSERGNFPVFKKNLRQWMMRITAYSDRLADDLDRVDWPDKVKAMQRNWIGRSQGARVSFPVVGSEEVIDVFTTRPDTLFGATFMVLAPEHPLLASIVPPEHAAAVADYRREASRRSDVERQMEGKDKTGVFTGAHARNPATGAEIPVYVADYVLAGYGTGAIMAVPGQDQRDWDFATRFDLPIIRTVQPSAGHDESTAFTGEGPAINSSNAEVDLDGLGIVDAKARVIDWLEQTAFGEGTVNYKLRDWLFSRQRYWGEPFPIVFDADGNSHAVPDSMLPVELPDVPDYSPKTFDPEDDSSEPEPPLGRVGDWVEVDLDLGDGRGVQRYRRETNTMPNWAGSCWYYLRYLDPANHDAFVDPDNERYWMGPYPSPVAGAPAEVQRPGRRRPLHRRRRACRPPPALRALLAQGALRPRAREQRGAVPDLLQPGLHPGARLPRRPRPAGRGQGGRGPRRRGRPRELHLAGAAGAPGVRQDRQVAQEHGEPGRDVLLLRRRHAPALRDGDGAARAEQAVGDARRRRQPALPPAAVAQRRRRGDRRGRRHRRAGGGRARAGAAQDGRRGLPRLRVAVLQHGHRAPHRAQQRPDQAGERPSGRSSRRSSSWPRRSRRTSARSCGVGSVTTSRSPTRPSPSPTRPCSSRTRSAVSSRSRARSARSSRSRPTSPRRRSASSSSRGPRCSRRRRTAFASSSSSRLGSSTSCLRENAAMTVAIVTDSTAYLPAELASGRRIEVVPLHVVIGGTEHREGVDVTSADVAEALRSFKPVSTSRPTPAAVLAAYERAVAAGADEIVSVHMSADMSSTIGSAHLAAKEATVPVHVVDSRSLGMAMGFAVLAAADAADRGATGEEVADVARRSATGATVGFYVDTLEYLRRGGRIGAASALVGSALAIKPILTLRDGSIVPLERVRTASKALDRLGRLALDAIAGAGSPAAVRVAVHHLDNPERAAALAARLAEALEGQDVPVVELGAVVGAHVGPGTVAFVVTPPVG